MVDYVCIAHRHTKCDHLRTSFTVRLRVPVVNAAPDRPGHSTPTRGRRVDPRAHEVVHRLDVVHVVRECGRELGVTEEDRTGELKHAILGVLTRVRKCETQEATCELNE